MEKRTPPDNHMIWAVLSTFCCCLPLGIASVYYASKVEPLYNTGDYEGAYKAADNAKKFATWAVIPLVIFIVIYSLILLFAGIASLATR